MELINGKPLSSTLPEEWQMTDEYNSHRPVLYAAIVNTKGKIMELGCGYGSTPLLKAFCDEKDRWLISLENDMTWALKFPSTTMASGDYNEAHIFTPCSVIFIDSRPGELRKDLIRDLANKAEVLVVHDTEEGALDIYGIREVLNGFTYRQDYKPEKWPGTSLVSNSIDVLKWIIPR